MRLAGRTCKDRRPWLVDVQVLDVMAQGRIPANVVRMIAGLVATRADDEGFALTVHPGRTDAFAT